MCMCSTWASELKIATCKKKPPSSDKIEVTTQKPTHTYARSALTVWWPAVSGLYGKNIRKYMLPVAAIHSVTDAGGDVTRARIASEIFITTSALRCSRACGLHVRHVYFHAYDGAMYTRSVRVVFAIHAHYVAQQMVLDRHMCRLQLWVDRVPHGSRWAPPPGTKRHATRATLATRDTNGVCVRGVTLGETRIDCNWTCPRLPASLIWHLHTSCVCVCVSRLTHTLLRWHHPQTNAARTLAVN